MNRTLRLLPLALLLSAGCAGPASAQNNQPIGTANTGGAVANFNARTPSSSGVASSSSSGRGASTSILLPSGRTATQSNSTIVVCDDPGAPFPDVVDVCALRCGGHGANGARAAGSPARAPCSLP